MKLSGMFDFKSQIVSEDVNFGDDSTKVSKYNFDLHTRLSQSIKADIKYQLISSKSERLSATSQSQKGNPEVVMGALDKLWRSRKSYKCGYLIWPRWG